MTIPFWKAEVGLRHIDVVLVFGLARLCGLGGSDLALLELIGPQRGEGDLLGPVHGDGVTMVDPVGGEFFLADELMDQIDLGVLDLIDIDLAQQAKQGVGMRECLELWKQAAQVWFEHGAGHLPIGLASRGVLEHEGQDPVEHQGGQLMYGLFGVADIRDRAQPAQQ